MFKKSSSLALLVYLVLFLNFGPAWHRAPVFGLHEHGEEFVEASCDCGHEHGAQEGQEERSRNLAVTAPACECSLCEFFKQYQVSLESPSSFISTELIVENLSLPTVHCVQAFRLHLARGPPAV